MVPKMGFGKQVITKKNFFGNFFKITLEGLLLKKGTKLLKFISECYRGQKVSGTKFFTSF